MEGSIYKKIAMAGLAAILVLQSAAAFALTPQEERQQLEKELAEVEKLIKQYENDITKTQQEKKTLQNKVASLNSKIKRLDLEIRQSSLMVSDLRIQIVDTEGSIEKTEEKIQDSKKQISEILRAINEEDQKPFAEIFLAEASLSGFFENLADLENLNDKSRQLLQEIQSLKLALGEQKESLGDEKEDLEKVLKMQTLQKAENQTVRKTTEKLLTETKGKESEYQKTLAKYQKKAQEIRNRIFEVAGTPNAPTFAQALDLARWAGGITGVRPAFLLAILTQESNIGKNVGQCYVTNYSTGAGVSKTGKAMSKVMSPTRDIPPFLQITQALGRDPKQTAVSCPMSYGWGGAMGPAQFIPSTWNIYKSRISAITGKPSDPWSIKDAFLAAALYVSDYGAATQTRNGEWRSAMIYFSGSVNTKYRFYGDSVLRIADGYEDDIAAIAKGTP